MNQLNNIRVFGILLAFFGIVLSFVFYVIRSYHPGFLFGYPIYITLLFIFLGIFGIVQGVMLKLNVISTGSSTGYSPLGRSMTGVCLLLIGLENY